MKEDRYNCRKIAGFVLDRKMVQDPQLLTFLHDMHIPIYLYDTSAYAINLDKQVASHIYEILDSQQKLEELDRLCKQKNKCWITFCEITENNAFVQKIAYINKIQSYQQEKQGYDRKQHRIAQILAIIGILFLVGYAWDLSNFYRLLEGFLFFLGAAIYLWYKGTKGAHLFLTGLFDMV